MSAEPQRWLDHPDHGACPVVCLLDCVFALTPGGRILHFHREQVDAEARSGEERFRLNGAEAAVHRAQCQIIPPFVTEFGQVPEEKQS